MTPMQGLYVLTSGVLFGSGIVFKLTEPSVTAATWFIASGIFAIAAQIAGRK